MTSQPWFMAQLAILIIRITPSGPHLMCWNYDNFHDMRSSDIICPQCHAGYRRIEVASGNGTKGEFYCRLCDHLLEVFDGSAEVAIRLTIQPEKTFNSRPPPLEASFGSSLSRSKQTGPPSI